MKLKNSNWDETQSITFEALFCRKLKYFEHFFGFGHILRGGGGLTPIQNCSRLKIPDSN